MSESLISELSLYYHSNSLRIEAVLIPCPRFLIALTTFLLCVDVGEVGDECKTLPSTTCGVACTTAGVAAIGVPPDMIVNRLIVL